MNWKNEALGLKAAGSGYLYVTDGGIPHSVPYIRSLRQSSTQQAWVGTERSRPKSWLTDSHIVAVHLRSYTPAVLAHDPAAGGFTTSNEGTDKVSGGPA